MEILGVAALLALLTLATGSIVKQHKCNLEGGEGLCGWQIISQQGITAGITRASDTAPPALPVDYSPGTENGSYFYFNGSYTLSTETRVLTFPTQKYLLNISFAYYISSSLELILIQENIHHVIIESNQTLLEWEKTSYILAPPAATGGIILSVETFDLGEGTVDPQSSPLIMGIDDITMTYQLPCDYDLLNQLENLVLVVPAPLQQLPLGTVTHLMFNATSPVCPTGPFVFQITSVLPTALEPIFTIDVSTGAVAVDTTGPHLLVQGASGLVTVSVHVADSDYANSGSVFKRKYPMPFVQPRTIVVLSPNNITVGINVHFSYCVEAVSKIGQNVTLQLLNLTTVPASLANELKLSGSNVSGIISYDSIADISSLTGFPSFSVQVRDNYGGTLTHSVLLIIPELPPIFDSLKYTFNISEHTGPDMTEAIGVISVLDPNGDTCQEMISDLFINTTDPEIQANFHAPLLPIETDSPFCRYQLASTAYLNYEARTSYTFSVVATDSVGMSSTASVTVNVLPVNEFPPSFVVKMVPGEVSDYSPVGTGATAVEATDKDGGDDGVLDFSITDGNSPVFFRIVKTSANRAAILVAHSPVSPGTHILTVVVSDEGNPPMTDTATVTITVIASTIVNCTTTGLGPPQLTVPDKYPIIQPVHSTVTFYCNNTANPPSFPIVWLHQSQSMPLLTTLIANDHYTIANDSLTLHNITAADDGFYICNVTNLCGYTKRTIHMTIIDLPYPPMNVSISQGPFWNNISLTWEPSVSTQSAHPVNGYIVRVRETGQEGIVTTIPLPYYMAGGIKTNSVVVDSLLPGTSYTVTVAAMNMIGETPATPLDFITLSSAPQLSMLTVSNHPNDKLIVQWHLDYTGGSPNVTMTIMIRAHGRPETSTTRTVPVEQESFQSPTLDSGLSYDIITTVSTPYGSSQYSANAFIGFTDNTTCDFGSSSTCQWQLQQANLTSADNAPSPLPSTDAVGSTPAYYISGQPLATTVSSIQLIRYPSLSYVCGYSFYYQTQSGVRLVLKATNGIVWWESGVTGTSSWERVNVTVGELSPEVDENVGVEFVMERVGSWTALSYAAIDDITLHFCLPCDISSVQLDHFTTSYPTFFKVYLRSQQDIQLTTSVQDCPHAQLKYAISSVIPNELKPYFVLPSSSAGRVVVSDITPNDAAINTEGRLQVQVGITQADYKHQGISLTDTLSIRFLIGENFQNCSFRSSCDFEIDQCNWDIKNQSNIFINTTEENSFLIAYPPLSSTSSFVSDLWRYTINDSYCGISFRYMLERTELQVAVDGLGTIWNSQLVATMSPNEGVTSWESATVFIDIEGVESLAGRGVEFEMVVYDDGVMGEGTPEMRPNDVFVAVDNITLNPCVDCQAKECSCVSCIKQCTNDPCQPGNYLALEINTCRPCPVGHYCTNWRQPPTPCPTGTYNNVTSASLLTQCRPCPRGNYTLQTGAETCQSCPMGYQCSNSSSLPTCDIIAILNSCPSGYYHTTTSNNCVQCEPGYACYNGVRVPCSSGFYASQPGSTSCTVCNAGHHCPNSDQQPLECPPGQYSSQGMTSCLNCVSGYVSQAASSQCTISGVSLNNVVAGVMGAIVGIIITLLLTTICCGCYCWYTRRRRQLIKERERRMYSDNFLMNPDENLRSTHGRSKRTGRGPQTGTVSTIMSLRSLMSSTSGDTTMSFRNSAYDSDNESDGEMGTTSQNEYTKTRFTNQGDDVIDWRDTNPFIHTSPSESDMSVMVELEGQEDHVWPALARKKKESKM